MYTPKYSLRVVPLHMALCAALLLSAERAQASGMRPHPAVPSASAPARVSIKKIARDYSLDYHPHWQGLLRLKSPLRVLSFQPNRRTAFIDEVRVLLDEPVTRERNKWHVDAVDFATIIDPLLNPLAYLGGRTCKTIVLDPGHGGKDQGAEGHTGAVEKTLSLDVAKRVRALLAQDGYQTYLTREFDRYLTLEERTQFARDKAADLFVSIHINASENAQAEGIETFVRAVALEQDTLDACNTILAASIQRNLLSRTQANDRGLRRAGFYVIKNAPCTAVLVECGFLSAPKEEARLLSGSYRQRLARGIYDGIRAYARQTRKAQLFDS